MLIGANVRASRDLLPALEHGADIGADVVQIFTTSPRVWKSNVFAPELLEEYRLAQLEHPTVRATFCHASYLINIATTDPELLAKSRACLLENLRVATAIASSGLVLHLGSHLGAGFGAVVGAIADELRRALDGVEDLLGRRAGPLLMENAAGAGGTCGRDFGELAAVLEAAGGDERLGVCLDTQHLFASGADYRTLAKADAVVIGIDGAVGLERLACIHLNDSKSARGSNRDRHANLGDGLIGPTELASLLGHPRLQHLSAVLETPGLEGHGPGARDLAAARRLHAAGVRRWQRRCPAAGARTCPAPAPRARRQPPTRRP
ncbi:MAG TPA: deoxyribonuclease IV [Acidimicrobiales bacterium]|nr:deoxyribonuclease IV [Acidimicrobiales bacterium]